MNVNRIKFRHFFKPKNEIFALNNQFVFKTIYKLSDEKIGVMLYNFDEGNTEIEVEIDDKYFVETVLYGEVEDNTLSMKEKYCYLILNSKIMTE